MLQDLAYGRLENEFHNWQPQKEDVIVCVGEQGILIRRDDDDSLHLPTFGQVSAWENASWHSWGQQKLAYIFRLQEQNYFLWLGQAGDCPTEEYHFESPRQLRQLQSKDMCFAAMTAWHLYHWYRVNRYCGCCGTQTVHDGKERMLRCPSCGNMIFPRISPAVIIAITDGDRLLLSKYAGRSYTRYALIAGYTEIGETLEQTVKREVMEEVGLQVTNIRYYKSQPWGVDGNVLMGFFCDLQGDDTVHLDTDELAMAAWYPRDSLPAHDDGISLTREMIRVFEEGNEPK